MPSLSLVTKCMLFLSMLIVIQNVQAATHSVDEIIKAYYPLYNEDLGCQGVISGAYSYDDGQTDEFGYCINIDRQVVVETHQGKRLYVLVTGDLEFDGNGDRRLKGHAISGLAGMFVLKSNKDGWEVESVNHDMSVGASGYGLIDWKLIQVTTDKWAFVNEQSDMQHGLLQSNLIILFPLGSDIVQNVINSGLNFEGTGNCGYSELTKCDVISAKLHHINKSKTVNGFYPLVLVVNGYKEGKIYKRRMYTITYQKNREGTGYQTPYNYPLKYE